MNGRGLLAYNLKVNRARRGLSQEALADHAGIDKKAFCSLEHQTKAGDVDVIGRLATALQIPIADLFRPTDEQPATPFMKAGRRFGR